MVFLSLKKVAALAALAVIAPSTMALAQTELRGPQWPVLPPNALPATPEDTWSKAEVDAARARCNAVAAKYGAAFESIDPIRDGACGTPYPVNLTRLGKVTLSQPATLNCDMVAAVGDWMKADVQPAAKKILGQRVTRIEVLSSYSCRNAYGRRQGRLSEHGRANALDIRGFSFEGDSGVDVLADWGMTDRDIKAKIAAAEKAARKLAETAAKAKPPAAQQPKAVAHAEPAAPPHIIAAEPSLAEQQARQQHGIGLIPSADGLSAFRGFVSPTIKSGDDDDRSSGSIFVWGQPSRLGGPKANEAKASEEGQPAPRKSKGKPTSQTLSVDASGHTPRQRFLRELHESACKRFGTALGPEANEAHRNHLHIDLADRGGRGSYCR